MLRQARLPNHGIKRALFDRIVGIVGSDIDEFDLAIHDASIATMACGSLAVKPKAVLYDDGDKFAEGAI